jgi:hypothetical protein
MVSFKFLIWRIVKGIFAWGKGGLMQRTPSVRVLCIPLFLTIGIRINHTKRDTRTTERKGIPNLYPLFFKGAFAVIRE